jgi:hypothetical protein
LRAQLISESSRVVSTSGKASAMMLSSPIYFLAQEITYAAVRLF